jgi:hypothetical protein
MVAEDVFFVSFYLQFLSYKGKHVSIYVGEYRYSKLSEAGAERNIFGSATLFCIVYKFMSVPCCMLRSVR